MAEGWRGNLLPIADVERCASSLVADAEEALVKDDRSIDTALATDGVSDDGNRVTALLNALPPPLSCVSPLSLNDLARPNGSTDGAVEFNAVGAQKNTLSCHLAISAMQARPLCSCDTKGFTTEASVDGPTGSVAFPKPNSENAFTPKSAFKGISQDEDQPILPNNEGTGPNRHSVLLLLIAMSFSNDSMRRRLLTNSDWLGGGSVTARLLQWGLAPELALGTDIEADACQRLQAASRICVMAG